MAEFKRAEKMDRRGRVVIKIFLDGGPVMSKVGSGMPKTGNLKEELTVMDATVSEVAKVVERALFSDEQSE